MIRDQIKNDLQKVIKEFLGLEVKDIHLEHPANPEHGDYSSNVAMKLKEVERKRLLNISPKQII